MRDATRNLISDWLIGYPTRTRDDYPLPWTLGITEEHLDSGVDEELGVLGHLFALIPGHRLPEVFGKPVE